MSKAQIPPLLLLCSVGCRDFSCFFFNTDKTAMMQIHAHCNDLIVVTGPCCLGGLGLYPGRGLWTCSHKLTFLLAEMAVLHSGIQSGFLQVCRIFLFPKLLASSTIWTKFCHEMDSSTTLLARNSFGSPTTPFSKSVLRKCTQPIHIQRLPISYVSIKVNLSKFLVVKLCCQAPRLLQATYARQVLTGVKS